MTITSFQTSEDGKKEKMENDKQEKSGDCKQEKKNDQPPQAKKPKVKTKTVELPVQNNLHWQLPTDVLNMFVENEVMLFKKKKHLECLAHTVQPRCATAKNLIFFLLSNCLKINMRHGFNVFFFLTFPGQNDHAG